MKKIIDYFHTEQGAFVKNSIVCAGASVVLLGALFKLMHWPGASPMLVVGMGTEVFLFAFFAILPPHKEYYWEKLYPGLDQYPFHDDEHGEGEAHPGITQQLDQAISQAEVNPEMLEGLGKNLKQLGQNVAGLSDLTDATVATEEFTNNTRAASQSLSEIQGAYHSAAEAAGSLAQASEDASGYREQVREAAQKLSSLNEMYEAQLQDTNKQTQSMSQFYDNVSEVVSTLQESVEDTKRYKAEISELSKNLASLNSIYGNMLSAMTNVAR